MSASERVLVALCTVNVYNATRQAKSRKLEPMPESRVTLHEVAARADVSIATASRALNGLPVSAKNLARVRKAVTDLGYVPNEAARALRSERTQTMGCLFFDLTSTLGIDLLDGLSESIEDAGYSLLISTARGDRERYDRLMRRFLERRIDALFCIQPRGPAESLAHYRAADVPVLALLSRSDAFGDVPLLTPSFSDAATALADHLRTLGHRCVALVHPDRPRGPHTAIGRALRARGVDVCEIVPSEAGGMSEILAHRLGQEPRVTALVAGTPYARGLQSACETAGVSVPSDLSLVSVSDIGSDTGQKRRGLSTLVIDPHRLGRAAGAAMLASLEGMRPAPAVRVQGADFVPRASTGPAPAARRA